ncbi:MAG TPA: two-component regulator propeller domain-containing protein, partial [Flavobacteriales bacterium]
MLRRTLLPILVALALPAAAQRYFFENISVQQGLPSSKVYAALQDSTGLVWFGTEAGLASYDGIDATPYGPIQGTAPNGARSLCLDKDGALWIGHLGGGLSRRTGSLFHPVNIADASITSDITGIVQDKEGALWISTFGQGVFRIRETKADSVLNAERFGTDQGLSERIAAMTLLHSGDLVFLEDKNTFQRWAAATGKITAFAPPGMPSLHRITTLYEDGKQGLWVGTVSGGAFHLPAKGGPAVVYDFQSGMPSNFVFSFGEDALGRVWIGTWDKGAVRVEAKGLQRYDPGNGLHSIAIRAIARDREGNMLICTNDNGVDLYKGERFVNFGLDEGLVDPQVWAVLEDRSGHVWFGTNGGISVLDPGNFSTARVKNVTMQQGALTTNRVRFLRSDAKGMVWVGTENGGLFQMDPVNFVPRYAPEMSGNIPDNRVTALETDAEGNIWVGTINGLIRSRPGGTPDFFNVDNGLPANNITALGRDRKGRLWVGCANKGAARIVGNKAEAVQLAQGITPTAFTWDDAGNTYIGTEGSGVLV